MNECGCTVSGDHCWRLRARSQWGVILWGAGGPWKQILVCWGITGSGKDWAVAGHPPFWMIASRELGGAVFDPGIFGDNWVIHPLLVLGLQGGGGGHCLCAAWNVCWRQQFSWAGPSQAGPGRALWQLGQAGGLKGEEGCAVCPGQGQLEIGESRARLLLVTRASQWALVRQPLRRAW